MASAYTSMSSIGTLAAPSSRVMDKKLMASSDKLTSRTSISSFALPRRQSVVLRRTRSSKISAMAKELHFNQDGSAIKKLQVSSCLSSNLLAMELL